MCDHQPPPSLSLSVTSWMPSFGNSSSLSSCLSQSFIFPPPMHVQGTVVKQQDTHAVLDWEIYSTALKAQNLPWSPKLSLSTPQPEAPSWGGGCWDGAPVAGPVPAGRAVPLPLIAPMPLSSAKKLALSSFATYTPTHAIRNMSMCHIQQTTGDSRSWDLPASCLALSISS